MSRRNRNRSVQQSTLQQPEGRAPLDTPEDDLEELDDRSDGDEPGAGDDDQEEPDAAAIKARLDEARALSPARSHWPRFWIAGRDAAVAAVAGGSSVADVRAGRVPDVGCRDCWSRGRDAALKVIVGEA